MSQPNKPKDRASMDTAVQPLGMYAVFRHERAIKNARFSSLHETQESAYQEAQRLTAKEIGEAGADKEFCFYVVQLVGRVGLVGGKLIAQLTPESK